VHFGYENSRIQTIDLVFIARPIQSSWIVSQTITVNSITD